MVVLHSIDWETIDMRNENVDAFKFKKDNPFTTVRESELICDECNFEMYEERVDGKWIAVCDNCELNFKVEVIEEDELGPR